MVDKKTDTKEVDVSTNDAPMFELQRVYMKEASLEQPNSPQILLNSEAPEVQIQLGVGAESLQDNMYEVTVLATVETKIKEKTLFLVEVKQAGIFAIHNIDKDQMSAILGIACPQIVYPYLRANISDIINRAGFPPVYLAEINFQAMYEQQMKEKENKTTN